MERYTRQERDTWTEKDRKDDKYAQGNKPTQENQSTQNVKEIVKGFVGRNVNVIIRGKKTLSGKLESVSNYELLLTVKHEPVLIMKHAIDYIELVATPS
jgi:sRNA-binding regulator protein Hfq